VLQGSPRGTNSNRRVQARPRLCAARLATSLSTFLRRGSPSFKPSFLRSAGLVLVGLRKLGLGLTDHSREQLHSPSNQSSGNETNVQEDERYGVRPPVLELYARSGPERKELLTILIESI
jgi:hypothetical protein